MKKIAQVIGKFLGNVGNVLMLLVSALMLAGLIAAFQPEPITKVSAWHGTTSVSCDADGWNVSVNTIWNGYTGEIASSSNLSGKWGNNPKTEKWSVDIVWKDANGNVTDSWSDNGKVIPADCGYVPATVVIPTNTLPPVNTATPVLLTDEPTATPSNTPTTIPSNTPTETAVPSNTPDSTSMTATNTPLPSSTVFVPTATVVEQVVEVEELDDERGSEETIPQGGSCEMAWVVKEALGEDGKFDIDLYTKGTATNPSVFVRTITAALEGSYRNAAIHESNCYISTEQYLNGKLNVVTMTLTGVIMTELPYGTRTPEFPLQSDPYTLIIAKEDKIYKSDIWGNTYEFLSEGSYPHTSPDGKGGFVLVYRALDGTLAIRFADGTIKTSDIACMYPQLRPDLLVTNCLTDDGSIIYVDNVTMTDIGTADYNLADTAYDPSDGTIIYTGTGSEELFGVSTNPSYLFQALISSDSFGYSVDVSADNEK